MKKLLVFLSLSLLLTIAPAGWGQTDTSKNPPSDSKPAVAQRLESPTSRDLTLLETRAPLVKHPKPGPNEANISRFTVQVLQQQHYLQQPLNDALSSKFLDRYLEALDPTHMHYLKADIQEFERYRTILDDLTAKVGDTTPGRVIFDRFMERLEQRVAYVEQLLKTESFEFNIQERISLDRKKAARPENIDEAKKLWRQYLRYEVLQEKLNKEKPEEISKKINKRYARLWRTLHEYDADDIFDLYLSVLTHVYDPHSDYMGRAELEDFAVSMKLSLFGIGALLESVDGYCRIKELVAGGPAERSKKLKPNDRIIAVAQDDSESVDVVEMKLRKVVELIRGKKDTEVRLTIIPADAADPSVTKTVSLIRDEIKLEDQEAKARLYELPSADGKTRRIGVIDLPSFYASFDISEKNPVTEPKSTTADVAKLIRKLESEKIEGLILDLRRNGGGSLEEAIDLTGLFIPEGPVVQVKDQSGKVVLRSDTDSSVLYNGPLIVLTSRFSASASEILAGALQDYGRALIVGDQSTHGKGTVQSLLQLDPLMRRFLRAPENPGALKFTVQKFYRASGSSTQLKGVTPDIVLPSLNNHPDLGEAALENALPWDTIPSAKFQKQSRVQAYLTELQKSSLQRIEKDQDFIYLEEDIQRMTKAMEDKSVSLNEADRLKEKDEAETRSKQRQAELKNRPPSTEIVYELTLKNAALTGLPEPGLKTKENKTDPKPAPDTENTTDDANNKVPPVDVTLKETKRILLDFIDLTLKDPALAASQSK